MTYSDFTLAKAKDALGLVLDERQNLFRDVAEVEPSVGHRPGGFGFYGLIH